MPDTAHFTSFVMFAAMRTGSNFLESNLNALDGVTCHGEIFNPHFMGKKDREDMFGITIDERDTDPLRVLQAMKHQTEGLAGFRIFHDHDPRVIAATLGDPTCAKIILTRNPVDSFVSLQIARATNQWRLTNATMLKTAQVPFDGAAFEQHLQETQGFQIELMRELQTSGQTAFYIDYEDLSDLTVLNGLAAFLGVQAQLTDLDPRLKKQNPEDILQKVLNPEDLSASLARLDRFNLARTPNFEPRRAPSVPGFVAAAGAPLLYLPVKGGPEAAVSEWLSQTGSGGLTSDFSYRMLRQWKTQTPNRSFSVLRHPLARAHESYCLRVLSGQQDVYRLMTKAYAIDLPRGEGVTPDTHRAGFLAFLRWMRIYLSAQTRLKPDPCLASQAAVIQGYGQVITPDAILREDTLEAGLSYLASEVGVASPALTQVAAPTPFTLDEIWGEDLEIAARDAYQRDYQTFGFGRWRT